MKYFIYCVIVTGAVIIGLISCENQNQKGERLARQYCSNCHLFTEPGMIDKKNWEENVLPQMAFRMGFSDMKIMSKFTEEDLDIVVASNPMKPMVSKEEWEAIKHYFLTNAPDTIITLPHTEKKLITQFEVTPIHHAGLNSWITLLRTDTVENKVWVGTRSSWLFELNANLTTKDSFRTSSPPSYIQFEKDKNHIISMMGIMDPNDQPKGSLQTLSYKNHAAVPFIDSLKRPVHFERADLNKDGLEDYVVCSFGNFTGSLTAFENKGNGQFKKHVLLNQPGARNVIIKDVNKDGLNDILVLMSQGDEQISLLTNAGSFNFRITALLRFPPVYGLSYFDIADFNKDGQFDIVYTNGDNADYSIILKSYHGVHVLLNDGKNKFTESWSYPMNGAFEVLSRDFDADGDLDIAALSFFPDWNHPEEGFMYFENTGTDFIPQVSPIAMDARWMVMDATDIDKDGDDDLILGALNFNNEVPVPLTEIWREKKTSLLLLRNNLKK